MRATRSTRIGPRVVWHWWSSHREQCALRKLMAKARACAVAARRAAGFGVRRSEDASPLGCFPPAQICPAGGALNETSTAINTYILDALAKNENAIYDSCCAISRRA